MISVLMYHQVDCVPSTQDVLKLAVPPDMFEQQMNYLYKSGYQCLSLSEALAYWIQGKPEPKKAVVITFDDGFRDLYTTVHPILEKFDFSATVFLVANRVGGKSDWEGQTPYPLLSWDEVRKLNQSKFTFGSHTLNHPYLSQLDNKQIHKEIKESKERIEQELGEQVNFFAYPYSDLNPQIQQIVQESGYLAACGGERQTWNYFNIWRALCTGNDGSKTYMFNARGWYRYIARLRQNDLIRPVARTIKQLIMRRA